MIVEKGVKAFLFGNASITALVPTAQIFNEVLPQNPIYPAITFHLIDELSSHTYDRLVGGRMARVQISSWSPSKPQAISVFEAVRSAFSAYRGPNGDLSGATQANPVEITSAAHGLATGDTVVITGMAGMLELNDRNFTITVTGANTFTLDGEDGTGYGAYVSGGKWRQTWGGIIIDGAFFDLVVPIYEADEPALGLWQIVSDYRVGYRTV